MGDKIKILYLIPGLNAGGAERQLTELLKNLDRDKFEPVLVLIYSKDQIFYKEIYRLKIKIFFLNKPMGKLGIFIALWRLILLLRKLKVDIVHSTLNMANFFIRVASILAPHQIIVTSIRLPMPPFWLFWEKILHLRSKIIIVNSPETKNQLINKVGVHREKVVFIPNGVDVQRFRRLDRDTNEICLRLGLSGRDFLIGVIARFSSQKNQLCLLKALKLLKNKEKLPVSVKVLFVGQMASSAYKRKIEQFIINEGLQKHCQLLSPIGEIEELYNLVNLIVLPSLSEGFPTVVLEAMACEKPVIVSQAANRTNLVQDGMNGFVFDNNDSNSLAHSLEVIFRMEHNRLKSIGLKGRKIVVEKFSNINMVRKIEEIYRTLVN